MRHLEVLLKIQSKVMDLFMDGYGGCISWNLQMGVLMIGKTIEVSSHVDTKKIRIIVRKGGMLVGGADYNLVDVIDVLDRLIGAHYQLSE